jgi:protein tyrosine phosphatase
MNIAAALEHLRDQRMGAVDSEEQYRAVFSCVAEEVSQLVRSLQR